MSTLIVELFAKYNLYQYRPTTHTPLSLRNEFMADAIRVMRDDESMQYLRRNGHVKKFTDRVLQYRKIGPKGDARALIWQLCRDLQYFKRKTAI